jgi:pyruvate formate-lyase activating enzyme-like uncharacterized protein
MIVPITPTTHGQIRNPAFARYATIYLDIYADFLQQVAATGVEIESEEAAQEAAARNAAQRDHVGARQARFRNGGRSIVLNRISPACVACQKGIGSATFFVSLQCHRDCYYCFNPNQVEYETYTQAERDVVAELEQIAAAGYRMDYLALTGGEPLLHRQESLDFFATAKRLFPQAHARLYTTGDHANATTLAALRDAGLREIRFSVRMHDTAQARRHTLQRIALAREYIPTVMVEMPVLPGTRAEMEVLLLALDELQIHSINLLEFCYPLHNGEAFRQRGFKIRRRPYETLYNYWYAGGVPVAGSEELCLDLLGFALDRELGLGVHYCSLENKLTGQNYQQNAGRSLPATLTLSPDDYLLKSAKVFGADIPRVYHRLRQTGYYDAEKSTQPRYLAFHVSQIEALSDLDVEIGLSTSTFERRADGEYLRELKVDLTTPQTFELARDV